MCPHVVVVGMVDGTAGSKCNLMMAGSCLFACVYAYP